MRVLAVLGTLVLAAGSARADIVREMTPETLAEAVAFAREHKGDYSGLAPYLLMDGDKICGVFTTPFSRAVALATDALKAYKEPELGAMAEGAKGAIDVSAFAKWEGIGGRNRVVKVVAVVIATDDSDKATITRPAKEAKEDVTYTNGFGARSVGTSMSATFPFDVFVDKLQLRIAYEGTPECRVWINLGPKVR
jgi:hypothetical protein